MKSDGMFVDAVPDGIALSAYNWSVIVFIICT
jgi:hypothetical protein